MWRPEDHTADVLLYVEASSWEALLEEAAAAFAGTVAGGAPPETAVRGMRKVAIGAEDPSEAWVAWWRALHRAWTVEGLLPVEAGVRAGSTPARTEAVLRCVPAAALDPARLLDVKAVTRHRAEVRAGAGGAPWSGRIVLDV